jgi:hypothetical protein
MFKITLKKRIACRKLKDLKMTTYSLHHWKQNTFDVNKCKARHWTGSWAISTHLTPLSVSKVSTAKLSYHLPLGLPGGNFQKGFPNKHFVYSLQSPYKARVRLLTASYISLSWKYYYTCNTWIYKNQQFLLKNMRAHTHARAHTHRYNIYFFSWYNFILQILCNKFIPKLRNERRLYKQES